MSINLTPIKIEEKDTVKKMLYLYEQELTGEENPPEYKYLDSYWEKENRKAYFVCENNRVMGFAFINQHLLMQTNGNNLAEFYIKKEYRKKGYGRTAAISIFALHLGKWELRELNTNTSAHNFWLKVISDYTHGNFSDQFVNNDQWHGWIQTFDTSTK